MMCLCGCGEYVCRGFYKRNHRPKVTPAGYDSPSWDYRRYSEQLARIPNTVMGRLAKKLLMAGFPKSKSVPKGELLDSTGLTIRDAGVERPLPLQEERA